MGRNSESLLVKKYCEEHQGELFDFGYLSSHHFKTMDYNNLRMIVSRLDKQNVIRKISKGIFIIGESDKSDEEIIIDHYLKDGFGMASGEYLLYKLGIIEDKPEEIEIYSRYVTGNKQIGNIKIIENRSSFLYGSPLNVNMLIELVGCSNMVRGNSLFAFSSKIEELVKSYTDSSFATYIRYDYGRINFVKLASILDSMHISNKVMEIYATKIGLLDTAK